MKQRTTVTNQWLSEPLRIGHHSEVSRLVAGWKSQMEDKSTNHMTLSDRPSYTSLTWVSPDVRGRRRKRIVIALMLGHMIRKRMNAFTQIVVTVGRVTPQGVNMLGTAFAVNDQGDFVTTGHVVGSQDSDLVVILPNVTDLNAYQDLADTSCSLIKATIREIDPIRDLAVIRADAKFRGVLPSLGSFDSTQVGEEIHCYGFPHCVHGRRALTFQKSYLGAKVIMTEKGLSSKHAVINIQARPGQSGSPIFNPRLSQFSGILVGAWVPAGAGINLGGINPFELHQTTHCISAEYVKEML